MEKEEDQSQEAAGGALLIASDRSEPAVSSSSLIPAAVAPSVAAVPIMPPPIMPPVMSVMPAPTPTLSFANVTPLQQQQMMDAAIHAAALQCQAFQYHHHAMQQMQQLQMQELFMRRQIESAAAAHHLHQQHTAGGTGTAAAGLPTLAAAVSDGSSNGSSARHPLAATTSSSIVSASLISSSPSPCECTTSTSGFGDGGGGTVRVYSSPLLLLQNESYFEEIPESSGCLILFHQVNHSNASNTTTSSSNSHEWTLEKLQGLLEGHAQALVEQCIVASPIDSEQEIQQSVALCRATSSATSNSRDTSTTRQTLSAVAAGRDDLRWWRHGGGQQQQQLKSRPMCLRNLTKLRRILQNMTMIISSAICDSENKDSSNNTTTARVAVHPLEFSLAQVLLRCPASQQATLKTLQHTFTALQSSTWTSDHYNSSNNTVDSTRLFPEYCKLQHLLVATIFSPISLRLLRASSDVADNTAKNQEYLLLLDIHNKRVEMQQEFEDEQSSKKRRKTTLTSTTAMAAADSQTTAAAATRTAEQGPLLKNQFVVYTQKDDMTEGQFLEESYFMHQVNATFHRVFHPSTSRPCFAAVNFVHPAQQVAALRCIFFKRDGSLQESVVADAIQTSKQHYIEFQNATSAAGKNDKRWQIPIRRHGTTSSKHSSEEQQKNNIVATRLAVEKVLSQAGILHLEHEHLHDMSLLVGGVEDQSLHHDTPRQYCIYSKNNENDSNGKNNNHKKRKNSSNDEEDNDDILGWEVNRLGYNHDMADRHAPSGIVIGMGNANTILMGVQKDQLEEHKKASSSSNEYCRIRNGQPHERFEIVRENTHLAVLKIPIGCAFTGDFAHAGVCNFFTGTPEYALMMQLFKKIDQIVKQAPRGDSSEKTHAETTGKLLKMFCKFPGLNRICRLHVSTELNLTTMVVPRNTVGYYRCHANLPDGRGGVSSSSTY